MLINLFHVEHISISTIHIEISQVRKSMVRKTELESVSRET